MPGTVALARAIDRLTEPAALARMALCACGSQLLLAAMVLGPAVVTGSTADYFPGLVSLAGHARWELGRGVPVLALPGAVAVGLLSPLGGWVAGRVLRGRAEVGVVVAAVALPFGLAAARVAMLDPGDALFHFGWCAGWAAGLTLAAGRRDRA